MTLFHLCSFESRRETEIRSLIERQGATATVAPSMRELPLEQNEQAYRFAEELLNDRVDLLVFMTGVGAEALLTTLELKYDRNEILAVIDRCQILVRGPKPTAVLKKWGIQIDFRVPEPNTWREILSTLDEGGFEYQNRTVAVQEYGTSNEEFYDSLTDRGASVMPVPIYRWALPEDVTPLQIAVSETIAGTYDALLFTSAQQAQHVLQIAEQLDQRDAFLTAAGEILIASIGPTCTETLKELGFLVGVEASPPKMGQLVRATIASLENRKL